MLRIWLLPVLFVACGLTFAARLATTGSVATGVLLGLLFVALGIGYSPLIYPRHVPAATAQARAAAEGRPILYWRPGCPFCFRLRLFLLGRARHASWVNIWRDPSAAAAVREVADGNETVPTLILPTGAHVNPSPTWARQHLAG